MKHALKITIIILGMFLLSQIFGIFLISKGEFPSFLEEKGEQKNLFAFFNILIAFVVATTFFFFLIQYKWKFFIKIWFGLVIFLALTITFFALISILFEDKSLILFYSLLISFFLTILKIVRPSIIIHNLTEILIYGGISLIFIPYFTPLYITIFLILISFYDMWAVWHTGFMQKMAKFQMKEIKIFNGFFVPYLTKDLKEKIKKNKIKKEKIKVPIAILGGGDIAFTLIPAGVFLRSFGLMAGIFVVLGGFFGLCYILLFSKKRAYPAMPYITIGIFLMLFLYFFFFRFFL